MNNGHINTLLRPAVGHRAPTHTRLASLEDIRRGMAGAERWGWQPTPARVAGLARWMSLDTTPGLPAVTNPQRQGIGQWRQGWLLDRASPPDTVAYVRRRPWVDFLEKDSGARPLAGLGEAPVDTAREAAQRAYGRLARQAVAQADYLAGARPADWNNRLDDTYNMVPLLFKGFEEEVRGRLGDSEAEARLLALITALNAKLREAEAKRPSMVAAAADAVAQWLGDVAAGVAAPAKAFIQWVLARALPYLRIYKRAQAALAAGQVPAEQASQVDAALSQVRAAVSAAGGGDLDEAVAEMDQQGLGALPALIIAAIAIALVLLGLGAWDFLKGAGGGAGAGIGWGTGVALVAAALLLFWPRGH